MAIRTIDDSKLQDIAVAIQGKDGGGTMAVDEMPGRIDALPTGGTLIPKTITQNGVYNARDDNADGYDVVEVNIPERNTLDELYANTLEIANIPSATSIGDYFFNNRSNLRNVIMPNVTRIEDGAFQGCSSLALTALPDGVTRIEDGAFRRCKMLYFIDLTAFTDPQAIPRLANANAFYDIPSTSQFIVKNQEMYDAFTTATNWSTHARHFQIKPSGVS